MYRGNFFISDEIDETLPLVSYLLGESYSEGRGVSNLTFSAEGKTFSLELSERDGRLHLCFSPLPVRLHRTDFHPPDCRPAQWYGVWGAVLPALQPQGEKLPPVDPGTGVGRNKETEITQIADRIDRAGGDYLTTFYPQPTFAQAGATLCMRYQWV